jgi:hypothetical protein
MLPEKFHSFWIVTVNNIGFPKGLDVNAFVYTVDSLAAQIGFINLMNMNPLLGTILSLIPLGPLISLVK